MMTARAGFSVLERGVPFRFARLGCRRLRVDCEVLPHHGQGFLYLAMCRILLIKLVKSSKLIVQSGLTPFYDSLLSRVRTLFSVTLSVVKGPNIDQVEMFRYAQDDKQIF